MKAITDAVGDPSLLSDKDRVVEVIAERGNVAARTNGILSVSFVIMFLGFAATMFGFLLQEFGRSNGAAPTSTVGWRILTFIALHLFLMIIFILFSSWTQRQHPEIFAAHHLLHALELIIKLLPDTPKKDRRSDVRIVRRDAAWTLQRSAKFIRKAVENDFQFLDQEGLDTARKREDRHSQVIRQYQRTLIYGSPQQIINLLPRIADTLSVISTHGLAELPRHDTAATETAHVEEKSEQVSRDAAFHPDDIALFRGEMARIYTSTASADLVLTLAGYPRERRPDIGQQRPDIAWAAIFQDLEHGVIADPYCTLLSCALESYRANPTLVALAQRYNVAIPPPKGPATKIRQAGWYLRRLLS